MKLDYRLALDLGSTSIGWTVLKLDENHEPCGIQRAGVRLFGSGRDEKSQASLAVQRRLARQQRRRRDRVLKRRTRFMNALVEFGLMPAAALERKALQELEPFSLRLRGLDELLTPHELGRALFHLARKRGFQSSRKELSGDEKDLGKIKSAIASSREQMAAAGARTYGELLAKRHINRERVLPRLVADAYALYPERALLREELALLCDKQAGFGMLQMTPTAKHKLLDIFSFQRRLRAVKPGDCTLDPSEKRALKALPLFERFRLLCDVNHIRVLCPDTGERPIHDDERSRLLAALETASEAMTWPRVRKAMGLKSPSVQLNFEVNAGSKKRLSAQPVQRALSSPMLRDLAIDSLTPAEQSRLFDAVLRANSVDDMQGLLADVGFFPNAAQLQQLAKIDLPDGYCDLGISALSRLVAIMEVQIVTYDQAVKLAGYQHHSHFAVELKARLPYYGEVLRGYTAPLPEAQREKIIAAAVTRVNPPLLEEAAFGRIANPTVHIGLNQLRRLVNAIIKRYGPPSQVVIELAREFGLSGEKLKELAAEREKNEQRNDRFRDELTKRGLRINRDNLLRWRLFDELEQAGPLKICCVYTGRPIGQADLFSPQVEIDHILPFSVTQDDGIQNMVLCYQDANRIKLGRSPFEAFGHSPPGFDWEEVRRRVEALFGRNRGKRGRFEPDALAAYQADPTQLPRHLNDTRYFSRVAKQYLGHICTDVWVNTGKLTSLLRAKYRLNEVLGEGKHKNRNDHRHHAVDAAVIGICDRRTVQRLSNAARIAEMHGVNRLLEGLGEPWMGFIEDIRATIAKVVVSIKPEHGLEAGLHNDTFYGAVDAPVERGKIDVKVRKSLATISTLAHVEEIADPVLRESLRAALASSFGNKKTIASAIQKYSDEHRVYSARRVENLSVVGIRDQQQKLYRFVKTDGNAFVEICREANGKWSDNVVTYFDAVRLKMPLSRTVACNGKALVMRLFKGDTLALDDQEPRRIVTVHKFSAGKVTFADQVEANCDARSRLKSERTGDEAKFSFETRAAEKLRGLRARRITVDELGFVNDAGFNP